jgi:anti-sigma regulatory factor (Ser/Thr protein kinase)
MAAHHSPFPRLRRRQTKNSSGWLPIDLGGHEVVARLHLRLKPGPQAAGEGRHALDQLEGALDQEQLGELQLLISELLTNSVRHSGSEDWITLDVEIYANAVRVVVTDRGRGFDPEPTPRPHLDRPGGWGLCLVNALADRWGVERNDRTSVWFEQQRNVFALA